jgi:Putative peptidoglycan binding domain
MKLVSTAVAAATITTASVLGAPTAQAALPMCDADSFLHVGNGWYVQAPNVWESDSVACNLKYGDPARQPVFGAGADAIKALQRNLNYCYRTSLAVDGRYGSLTRAAVTRVQRLHGITADGVYGPRTRSAMFWREYSFTLKRWSQRCYSPI